MNRKVFISVLGTGLYEKCTYVSGDFVSSETTFVQQATLQFHGASEWPENSKALFLLTEKARKDNWEVATGERLDKLKNIIVPYKGLHETLQSMHLPFSVEDISIPDGKNESEMWQIFESTVKKIEDGDELYFDLTHSFRYLPMLMLVLGNYAKFLRKVTVQSITYGNYEARDEQTNRAPIVDLLPLSMLQDWTFATADFIKNGYTDRLVELSQKGLKPLLMDGETRKDENVTGLNKLVSHLKDFSSQIQICRGMDIVSSISADNIKKDIQSLQKIVIPQLEPVLQEIHRSLDVFSTKGGVLNMLHAARWCYDNQLFQQATTYLEEGVISFFCLRHQIPLDFRQKRELITSAFFIISNDIPETEWKVGNPDWMDLLHEIIDDINVHYSDLIKTFNSVVDMRNDYNHCGMREYCSSPTKIKNRTNTSIDKIITLLYPDDTNEVSIVDNPNIFINLSNHPSSIWDIKQKESAEKFGEIVDILFPTVNPNDDRSQIETLADQYVKIIEEKAKNATAIIHVMGEMTFTYSIVSRLKERGIGCVASTSERIVQETPDGQKISSFQFVRFREY